MYDDDGPSQRIGDEVTARFQDDSAGISVDDPDYVAACDARRTAQREWAEAAVAEITGPDGRVSEGARAGLYDYVDADVVQAAMAGVEVREVDDVDEL